MCAQAYRALSHLEHAPIRALHRVNYCTELHRVNVGGISFYSCVRTQSPWAWSLLRTPLCERPTSAGPSPGARFRAKLVNDMRLCLASARQAKQSPCAAISSTDLPQKDTEMPNIHMGRSNMLSSSRVVKLEKHENNRNRWK